jgi:hypothetical protein
MKKEKFIFGTLILLALILFAVTFNDYLELKKYQIEWLAREKQINKLWQQYLEKDPNEEDLWTIVTKRKSLDLIELATYELLKLTDSEERLLYLLKQNEHGSDLRGKISDRLLENSSIEALKKIIEIVPEKTETALLALLKKVDSKDIEFDCLENVVINAPSHRKWAWDKILSKPEKMKPSLLWAFIADPNYPEEAVNAYFALNLKPEHYKELIFYASSLSNRAIREFLAIKPTNEDLKEIITGNEWGRHPEKEIKVIAAKYILANNPSEEEVDLIKRKCPDLREEA